jgi:hypothetical protein
VATLRSSEGQEHPVPARLLLGRSPACGLRLSEVHASSEHATLSWTGWQWELKDLGSRNGTWVDGGRLEPGVPVKLVSGTKLAFGDPAKTWELCNDDPPGLTAVNQKTGVVRVARDGLLVLPDDEAPEATFYLGTAGAWLLEDAEGNQRELRDQQLVSVGDDWQIQLPQVAEGTPLMQLVLSLDTASLVFAVSRNEERVEMTISHRGAEIPLEPREHGYVLVDLGPGPPRGRAAPARTTRLARAGSAGADVGHGLQRPQRGHPPGPATTLHRWRRGRRQHRRGQA